MKKLFLKSKKKNSALKQKKILLIGILISVIPMLLNACKHTEYIYKEPIKPPITCIDTIKTPLDMALCLKEYKLKY